MQARLGGGQAELAAGNGVFDGGDDARGGRPDPADHPVVVIAAAEDDLFVRRVAHPGADGRRLAEIEDRAGDLAEFAGRNGAGVGRQIFVAVDRQLLFVDRARRPLTRQVPIRMVGDVDDRRLGRRRRIGDGQLAGFVERIGRMDRQLAGITHIAVGADIFHFDAGRRLALAMGRNQLPVDLVEALGAAVQGIGAVIDRRGIGLAVDLVLALGNAVSEAADGRAEILRLVEIVLQPGITQRDVGALAVAVRRHQGLQAGAIGDDGRRDAVCIGQGHRLDGLAVGQGAEGRLFDSGGVAGGGRQDQARARGECGDFHRFHPFKIYPIYKIINWHRFWAGSITGERQSSDNKKASPPLQAKRGGGGGRQRVSAG